MSHLAAIVVLIATMQAGVQPGAVDYAAIYRTGVPFNTFIDEATARAADWRRAASSIVAPEAAVARLRELPRKRRLLVVAEASCSDSIATLPHLARLVEAAGDRVEMRIVNGRTGKPVMEAHRTPDGRAATPTVVVLDEDGAFIGAWSERPAALQKWYIEQKPSLSRRELLEQKTAWYEKDAGASAIAEIVALLVADRR